MYSSDPYRSERVLATARAPLAVCAFVAIYLDPTEPRIYASLTYALLAIFGFYSMSVWVWLQARARMPAGFPLAVHIADLLWAVALTFFTEGPFSPFFLFFVFLLLSAAFRWGFRETLWTTAIAAALLLAEGLLVRFAPLGIDLLENSFDLNRLIVRITYLLAFGILLGYLAGALKRGEQEMTVVANALSRVQASPGLRGAIGAAMEALLRTFGAAEGRLFVEDIHTHECHLWTSGQGPEGGDRVLTRRSLAPEEAAGYRTDRSLSAWFATGGWKSKPSRIVTALDQSGRRVSADVGSVFPGQPPANSFRTTMFVSCVLGEDWIGRVFLLDPDSSASSEAGLRFARQLVLHLAPVVHSAYLLRRLRTRVGAQERARLARDLHDGILQSIIAVEMQVDGLRRTMLDSEAIRRLEETQQLLRNEALELRELMYQFRPIEVTGRTLPQHLSERVRRFTRETGIQARFVTEVSGMDLSTPACREIVQIVNEALMNVRKHSRATEAGVTLGLEDGAYRLTLTDNGRGFDFSGVLEDLELHSLREGPATIRERVRSIGGRVRIDSTPDCGSRIEITIPASAWPGAEVLPGSV